MSDFTFFLNYRGGPELESSPDWLLRFPIALFVVGMSALYAVSEGALGLVYICPQKHQARTKGTEHGLPVMLDLEYFQEVGGGPLGCSSCAERTS